jgi:hypothetical protein
MDFIQYIKEKTEKMPPSEYIEPDTEMKRQEVVIGTVDIHLKALYTLFQQFLRKNNESMLNSLLAQATVKKILSEKVNECQNKMELLKEMFWYDFRESFGVWNCHVGIRTGFRAVMWEDNQDPLGRMYLDTSNSGVSFLTMLEQKMESIKEIPLHHGSYEEIHPGEKVIGVLPERLVQMAGLADHFREQAHSLAMPDKKFRSLEPLQLITTIAKGNKLIRRANITSFLVSILAHDLFHIWGKHTFIRNGFHVVLCADCGGEGVEVNFQKIISIVFDNIRSQN